MIPEIDLKNHQYRQLLQSVKEVSYEENNDSIAGAAGCRLFISK